MESEEDNILIGDKFYSNAKRWYSGIYCIFSLFFTYLVKLMTRIENSEFQKMLLPSMIRIRESIQINKKARKYSECSKFFRLRGIYTHGYYAERINIIRKAFLLDR